MDDKGAPGAAPKTLIRPAALRLDPAPEERGTCHAFNRQTTTETFAVTLIRIVASTTRRELMRGLLGGLIGASMTRHRR